MRPKVMNYLALAGLLLLVLAGCVTVKVSLFEEPEPLKEKTISGYGRDKVLLLDIHGMVLEGAPAHPGPLQGGHHPQPGEGGTGEGRQG